VSCNHRTTTFIQSRARSHRATSRHAEEEANHQDAEEEKLVVARRRACQGAAPRASPEWARVGLARPRTPNCRCSARRDGPPGCAFAPTRICQASAATTAAPAAAMVGRGWGQRVLEEEIVEPPKSPVRMTRVGVVVLDSSLVYLVCSTCVSLLR
jgi:hypothetical protein